MADDFAAIRKWMSNVEQIVDGPAVKRILDKGGVAGKKAALEAAAGDLGGDRRFSNWKRSSALSADYDAGSARAVVKFSGPWKLAETGRRSTGVIRPKRRRAVRTPDGLRARSSFGHSRGLKTYSEASRKAATTVPKAMHNQLEAEIRKALS